MAKPVRPKDYDRPGYRETGPKRRELARIAEAEARDFDWDLITEGEEWSENEKETYRRSHVIEQEVA